LGNIAGLGTSSVMSVCLVAGFRCRTSRTSPETDQADDAMSVDEILRALAFRRVDGVSPSPPPSSHDLSDKHQTINRLIHNSCRSERDSRGRDR